MIVPQNSLTSFESATKERLSFLKLTLIFQQRANDVDRHERVRMIAPQSPFPSFESAAHEGLGEVEHAPGSVPIP